MADIIINNGQADATTVINPVASLAEINTAKTDTLTYKNAASASATAALASENAAAASALSVSNDATAADNAKTAAEAAEDNVSTHATNASNSASAASTSAGQASTSASNASGSATTASNHATTASGYKDTATTQAGIATTKASEASTSAGEALAWRNETQVDRIAVNATVAEFNKNYWGGRATDPTGLDVTDGDSYLNTNTNEFMIRRNGLWAEAVLDTANTYTKSEVNGLLAAQDEATELVYDNTTSLLTAITVQDAIDEVEGRVDTAETGISNLTDGTTSISYDNTSSLLTAVNLQDAVDEVEARVDTSETNITNITNGTTNITFDNTTSGLVATTIKAAIDEVEARVDILDAKPINKYDAIIAPTVDNDVTEGYTVGSVWIDTVLDESYRCLDNTDTAAVWINTTLTTDEVTAGLVSNTPAGGIAATTVQAAIDELDTEKANLASPTFTGTAAAPTATTGTNTTQIATTAFVQQELTTTEEW